MTTSSHQRETVCVKLLAGASSVVCPCIAVIGLGPAARDRVERRRAGLLVMCVEITGCLNAAEGSPRPSACGAVVRVRPRSPRLPAGCHALQPPDPMPDR
jgi:hypothetical protein